MKIFIIEQNKQKMDWIKKYFKNDPVILVQDDFERFMNKNEVECVVSPANAFGLMDGGYDYAITKWFGNQLQARVQQYIIENLYGEQPVGTSIIVKANDKGQCLIHTPSMRTPSIIKDPLVVYQCMRSTLICAYQNNIKSILIPLFGGGCGEVEPQIIAKMMKLAYDQVHNPPKKLDWKYAKRARIV